MKKFLFNGKPNVCADRVRIGRAMRKMRQEDLAKKLQLEGVDIGRGIISNIERNKRLVTDYELMCMAKVLNVSVDWLLGLSDTPE